MAEDAFAVFYQDEYERSFRLAWLLTNGGSDCDDLVQDSFLRLQRHAGRLENPRAYLRTVLVNLCREAHRRRERDLARTRLLANGAARAMEPADLHLLELVADLPPAQRAVLVLRYWSDVPDTEIADILGIRPASVRSLVHRATRRLHKELSHDD
ncbi:MAG: putative polymerase subfamily sigma factor [Ilumatobacteraceae bacterium]|nr:putative polymerase subfamily sigma factor [Ilumatobacteraceae bacterium]